MPAPAYDFDPRNFPKEVLAAVGLIITCAAQTESILEDAIAGCLGIDAEYGGAITTHMPMPLKFSILRSISEIKIDSVEDLDLLDDILNRMEQAIAKRNAVAHHQLGRKPESDEVFAIKETARTSYEMSLLPLSVDNIERDALLIYELGMELATFLSTRGLFPKIPPARPRYHKLKATRKKGRKDR